VSLKRGCCGIYGGEGRRVGKDRIEMIDGIIVDCKYAG